MSGDDDERHVAVERGEWRDGEPGLVASDLLAREEPLEIRVNQVALAVVMRTPGDDEELVRGFLLSERIVGVVGDIADIRHCTTIDTPLAEDNVMLVRLAAHVDVDLAALRRNLYASSSCGVCGKASIEHAMALPGLEPERLAPDLRVGPVLLAMVKVAGVTLIPHPIPRMIDRNEILIALARIEEVVSRRVCEILEPSLAGGSAGALTFLASANSIRGGKSNEFYIDLLKQNLALRDGGASLHNGWLGAYWATCRAIRQRDRCSHLVATRQTALEIEEIEDAAEAATDFDLADGLVGLIASLREAELSTRIRVGRIVIRRLEELALRDGRDRPRWATPPERSRHHRFPHYDLGLYHGNPGVLLALAWLHDDLGPIQLSKGVAEWLLDAYGGSFAIPGSFAGPPSRTAWCYGHPGVACALLRASASSDEPMLSVYGLKAATHAAISVRPDPSYDAFWCHGSAGLVYMFWSLSRTTNARIFATAFESWLSHMLSQIARLQNEDWPCPLGLVNGLAGIGMCLLSITEQIDTTWECVMGLDFRGERTTP